MEIVTKRIDSVFGNNFRNFENFADTNGISLGHREREVTRCANYRGIENMQIGLPLKIREVGGVGLRKDWRETISFALSIDFLAH